MKRPKIQTYSHLHLFFKDWFEFLKSLEPKWSLRKFAQHSEISLGLASALQNPKGVLTPKTLEKILPALKLLPSEVSFLRQWMGVQQTKLAHLQIDSLRGIGRFKTYKSRHQKEIETFHYLSKWYHVAIREMADLPDFKFDEDWIQKKLLWKISKKEVQRAMKFLVDHKYIEFNTDGSVQRPEKTITCEARFHKLSLTGMHQEMLSKAQLALLQIPENQRHYDGLTVALNQEDFKKARAILNEALDRVSELVQKSSGTEGVYHIECVLFPMTKDESV